MASSADRTTNDTNIKPLDIVVLSGGPGGEREVSLESGKMVAEALRCSGHHVTICDINPDDLSAFDKPADVFFIALHGEFGEDGQIQRLLEDRNLIYTGSGPEASTLAMDKEATKNRLRENDIPTPAFDVVTKRGQSCKVSAPAVVKPVGSGSSVDVSIAKDDASLAAAIDEVVGKYGAVLVEQFVDGLEITVSILDGEALPPIEIRTKREFYNYQAKYIDDDTEYLFNIPLPADVLKKMQSLSLKASDLVGCRDFCRVDWMVDRKTEKPYLIEINTIPGLTSHSLLPKAAHQNGIDFDHLCQRIVDMAMTRAVVKSGVSVT